MISKYLFFIIVLVVTQIEAMRKPIQQPHPSSRSQVREEVLHYFRTLETLETELNRLVDNATDYHTTLAIIRKKIHENKYITLKDKKELLQMFEEKLDDKFFPKVTSSRGLPPVIKRNPTP